MKISEKITKMGVKNENITKMGVNVTKMGARVTKIGVKQEVLQIWEWCLQLHHARWERRNDGEIAVFLGWKRRAEVRGACACGAGKRHRSTCFLLNLECVVTKTVGRVGT